MPEHLDRQIEQKLEQLPKVDKPQTEQLYYYSDLSNVEKLMYHERNRTQCNPKD